MFSQLLLALGQGLRGETFPPHTTSIYFYHELPSSKAGREGEESLASDRRGALVSGEGEKDFQEALTCSHRCRMMGSPESVSGTHCITVFCHNGLKGREMV